MRLEAALQTTDTFSVVIFSEFYEKLRYGYASAMAFVLFAIILILTYLNTKIQGTRRCSMADNNNRSRQEKKHSMFALRNITTYVDPDHRSFDRDLPVLLDDLGILHDHR